MVAKSPRARSHRKSSGSGRATRSRLQPTLRREQLLRVASTILAEQGVEAVRIPEVARAAGVSRQIVYHYFSGRDAIVRALLEDFHDDLRERFGPATRPDRTRPAELASVFVHCVCDTIEAKGRGPWLLLGARGAHPEVDAIVSEMRRRLLEPWLERIERVTGARADEAETLASLFVGLARGVLDRWLDGAISRDAAVALVTDATTALLARFARA
jgi:AcrR family transcriptional regulator